MIVEINHYTQDVSLFLVSEITAVHFKCNLKGLSEWTYELVIIIKDNRDFTIWFSDDKKACETQYNKIKEALNNLYRKDTVESEIKNYLKNLNKEDFKS